ncbi:hypothetical protein [Amycolatopsis sp. NPDC049868]|uniref:hypothetical protein n=1 Tax=Amycolatopsis sp. NPDC049868 TaxID=3363934 RepID=UPI003791EE46
MLAQTGVAAIPGTGRRTWLEQNVAAAAIELDVATVAEMSASIALGMASIQK